MKIALKRSEAPEKRSAAVPHFVRVACEKCRTTLSADLSTPGAPLKCPECGQFVIVPREPFGPGIVVGDIIIRQQLREDFTGTVYSAYQRSLDRPCLLKILHPEFQCRQDVAEQLMDLARKAAKLHEQELVQCYSAGLQDDLYCFVNEQVPGVSLGQLLAKERRLPPRRALSMAVQMAEGLQGAWSKENLVHTDLNPENVFVMEEDEIRIAGLGQAFVHDPFKNSGRKVLAVDPSYLAPEVIADDETDQRAGMFSVGAILYECLTGHRPFTGADREATVKAVCETEPKSIKEHLSDFPDELDDLVRKLISKKAKDRYADWSAALTALKTVRDTHYPDVSTNMLTAASIQSQLALPAQPPKSSTARNVVILLAVTGLCAGTAFYVNKTMNSLPVNTGGGGTVVPAEEEKWTPAYRRDAIQVISVIPDPLGFDRGKEEITLINTDSQHPVDLKGWKIVELDTLNELPLEGSLEPNKTLTLTIPKDTIDLNDGGDELKVVNPGGQDVATVSYTAGEVEEGKKIIFR